MSTRIFYLIKIISSKKLIKSATHQKSTRLSYRYFITDIHENELTVFYFFRTYY